MSKKYTGARRDNPALVAAQPHRPRVVWPCALVRGVDAVNIPLRPAPVIFVRLLVWFE